MLEMFVKVTALNKDGWRVCTVTETAKTETEKYFQFNTFTNQAFHVTNKDSQQYITMDEVVTKWIHHFLREDPTSVYKTNECGRYIFYEVRSEYQDVDNVIVKLHKITAAIEYDFPCGIYSERKKFSVNRFMLSYFRALLEDQADAANALKTERENGDDR